MKKNLLPLLFIIIVVLMVPLVIFAADVILAAEYGPATQCTTTELKLNDFADIRCPTVVEGGTACEFDSDTDDCAMCCTVNTILKTTNWIFLGVMAISAVVAILGGYFIVTAGGNAEQVTKGRDYIKNSIIGLLIALLANAIPAVVRNVLGI
ncbi:MAG TPA: hypothetical protein ENH90_00890 [bacterium]|nr:hypothetical protein [bacterium]